MKNDDIVKMNFSIPSLEGDSEEIEEDILFSKVRDISLAINEIVGEEHRNGRTGEGYHLLSTIMKISYSETSWEPIEFKIPSAVRGKVIFAIHRIINE